MTLPAGGVLLDSSVIIAAERQQIDLGAKTAGRLDLSFLSAVTASELLHGVHRATTAQRQIQRATFVERVLEAFPVLEVDLSVARTHAKLWADLEGAGTRIGPHDLWIAATALANSLAIATHNVEEFTRVPGLLIEAW